MSTFFTGRKRLATGAILAASALLFTACGPSTGSTADDAEAAAADISGVEPADSITFWSNHPGGSIDIERDLIAAFEEETGISVELVTAGANYEEVSERFQKIGRAHV